MNYPLIDEQSVFDAVILCDGNFPVHQIPLSILRRNSFLCCCDNAGISAFDHCLTPDAIVGDGDSMPTGFRNSHSDIIHIIDEQDDNDQTKATRYCIGKGFHNIAYLGATGKREDHTLGNILLMTRYMDDFGIKPVMITDNGYFIPAKGRNSFATFKRQQVSIFNLSCSHLTGEGLRWQPYAYKSMWQGTLNEATGDNITLDGDGSYMVFLTHDRKTTEPEHTSESHKNSF